VSRGQPAWAFRVGLAVVFLVGLAGGVAVGRFALAPAAPAPAATPAVTAGVAGVGAGGVAQGIPVGYEHSQAGAAQAAGNFLAALGGYLALDPARAKAALDQVADPRDRPRLEASLASSLQADESLWGIQTAARQGRRVLLTQTPLAYRVDAYTPAQATVRVWLVTSVGVENRQRLEASYGIGSATLAWLDGDWRLRGVDAGSESGDVVPASLQNPTPTGGVPAGLDGFVPYGS
jgi:hypothetical protein